MCFCIKVSHCWIRISTFLGSNPNSFHQSSQRGMSCSVHFYRPYLCAACLFALITDFCTINRVGYGNYLKDHRSRRNARFMRFLSGVFYHRNTLLDPGFRYTTWATELISMPICRMGLGTNIDLKGLM